jgi:hypothetical protein
VQWEGAVRLRAGDKVRMLVALVTKQIVTTGEAIDVTAARNWTVQRGLGGSRLVVGALMPSTVFWVKKTFPTDRALVRPFTASQVGLLVTTESLSTGAASEWRRDTYLRSQDRSNVFRQPSTVHGKPPRRGACLRCGALRRSAWSNRSPGVYVPSTWIWIVLGSIDVALSFKYCTVASWRAHLSAGSIGRCGWGSGSNSSGSGDGGSTDSSSCGSASRGHSGWSRKVERVKAGAVCVRLIYAC